MDQHFKICKWRFTVYNMLYICIQAVGDVLSVTIKLVTLGGM